MLSLNKLLQWLILTLLFPLVFLNGWLAFKLFQYFQPIVTILVLATLLAFILDYPVALLEKRGIQRKYAVLLVLISTLVIVVSLGITLLPIALQQLNEMTKSVPQWIDTTEQKLQFLNDWAASHKLNINFSEIFTQSINSLPNELEEVSDKLFSIIVDTIDSVSEALITVVLTVYMLIDGERIWKGIFKKIPFGLSQQIQQSLQKNFQNFLIGQVILALMLGVTETILFLILKLRFGLVFGLGVGILSLVPFGDIVSYFIIAFILATHDIWLAVKVLVLSLILDQLVDQAIAPRILGSFTGLRPIWVIISLLIGTYVGGLLGLVLAVPLAGFIKDAIDGFAEFPKSISVEDEKLPEVLINESTLQ
ncbi:MULTISPECIES: AI-2E family transporter [Fischerella]|uniref:AI-2E family transporter n=1 Tax=Fischerella muscicola CCMEE 5323 TaxID=2019572 RepID=A0A2N6K8B7_FISMU|nr:MULTISPECIES: AI-2E family transporter [Fischerella]MBD2433611.1 AI-2E family transporter [Fischerella sp. FACHB-380]PLZ93559.1 AI-2E family transporter [Fischerella muscicola CCMEE 5323]